jgi:hypothetical protein
MPELNFSAAFAPPRETEFSLLLRLNQSEFNLLTLIESGGSIDTGLDRS